MFIDLKILLKLAILKMNEQVAVNVKPNKGIIIDYQDVCLEKMTFYNN